MEERKCFGCGGFEHVTYHCRNVEEERLVQTPSNKFEVLKNRVIQREEKSREIVKDRREILREVREKREVEVQQIMVEKKEKKKKKMLRKVVIKIELKQEEEEEIIVKALLDSRATGLVMSKEFTRKHRFKRMKLERPIYMRNIDGMLNYVGPIVDTVEVEIYFKEHKERTSIDIIGS